MRASYGAHSYAPGRGKTVALTFDDGPGRSTAAILKVLARYRVPATFFNIGANAAGRPGLVRKEVRAGYAMGDHTWDHPNMVLLSAASQAREIDRMNAKLKAVARMRACAFRPPYGNYDAVTLSLAQQRRMSVWLWSVDTQDWMARGSGSSYWISRIIRLAKGEGGALRHPVVLMHNQPAGNPATVAALPVIIRFFRSHGYRFVRL
jgi:peptidoglycan/xylan/chitin deacetylase (PgdA/CDA1 family)